MGLCYCVYCLCGASNETIHMIQGDCFGRRTPPPTDGIKPCHPEAKLKVLAKLKDLILQIKKAVYKLMFIKNQQIFYFLAYPNKLNRYLKLISNG